MTRRFLLPALLFSAITTSAQEAPLNKEHTPSTWENAVYLEEIVGDLPNAIKAYQSIAATHTNRKTVAFAKMRIAQCYEQLGEQKESERIFDILNEEYSDIKDISNALSKWKNEKYYPSDQLLDAPWNNNELAQYSITAKEGKITSYLVRHKTEIEKNGQEYWKTQVLSIDATQNKTSRIEYLVDAKTNTFKELKSHFMGFTFARNWIEDKKVHFQNNITEQNFAFDYEPNSFSLYDFIDVMRRLPLKENYNTTIKIHAPGNIGFLDFDILVTDTHKTVTTAAGEFVTFEIDITGSYNGAVVVSETINIENNTRRQMIRNENSSVIIELMTNAPDAVIGTTQYTLNSENLSFTLPQGWLGFHVPGRSDESQRHILLSLDGASNALIGWRTRLDIEWDALDLNNKAQTSIDWGKGFYKTYIPREETKQKIDIAGFPAIRYISDFSTSKRDNLEDRVWLAKSPKFYSITFYSSPKVENVSIPYHDFILNNINKVH